MQQFEKQGDNSKNTDRPKSVYIATYGCQMNTRDAEVIAGVLQQAGFGLADSADSADVVIFVTCAVRQHAEDKVWSEIGRIAKKGKMDYPIKSGNDKKNNQSRGIPIIGLVGCMAQEYKEKAFERSPDLDFVVGPQDIDKIPEIVKKIVSSRMKMSGFAMTQEGITLPLPLPLREGKYILDYPIKSGNDNHCKSDSDNNCELGSDNNCESGCDNSRKKGDGSLLFERKIWETDGEGRPEEIYHTGFYNEKDHAYVVISEGCSNFCSYCVVPYVRGPLRHRDFNEILREVEQAVKSGRRRITLLGQNVCSYGKMGDSFRKAETVSPQIGDSSQKDADLDPAFSRRMTKCNFLKNSFIDLLISINGIKDLEEISFITSHPKDTTIELFETMQGLDKVKKYLHLPVQSGSDRILKLMNRGYSRKYYLDLAENYRKIVKNGVLTTDIIVGFPGETEKDFTDTVDLVKQVEFNAGFIFKYSPRPFTSALNLEDNVPKAEKERRHAVILELQKGISKRKR